MTLTRNIISDDRTSLLGVGAGILGDIPIVAIYLYLVLRLLVPIGLIMFASRGATPAQRIALVGDYLTGAPTRDRKKRRR